MPPTCWLVGLFIFISLFFTYCSCAHMALNGSHGLALRGRLSDARTGRMEMKLLCVPGIPRWSPLGERSPRAQSQLHSTSESLGQRGRFGVGGRGAGREGVQPRDCSLTQRILSELLAGRAPLRLFFFKGLCIEYKSSSFTGLSHKLAPDTKTVIQMGLP